MQGNGLSRRERERRMHRAQILDAAERVFVRDGYQGATVERVAQEAEFAVGTLYNFFESKEKLFEEVITKMGEEVFGLLQEKVFNEPDPLAAVEALIDVRLAYPQEHRDFCQVFVDAAPAARTSVASALPEGCRDLYRRYLEAVAAVIRRGIAAGTFRDEDPTCLALCIEGAFQTVGLYWVTDSPAGPLAGRVAAVKRILLAMLCQPSQAAVEGRTE